MWSGSSLEKVNRPKATNDVKTRKVWANETRLLLNEITQARADLDTRERAIKAACNHTLSDGTSALEERMGEDFHYLQCQACKMRGPEDSSI